MENPNPGRCVSGNNGDNNNRSAGRRTRRAENQEMLSCVDRENSEESKLQPKTRKPRQNFLERGRQVNFFLSGEITHPQGRTTRNNMRRGSTLCSKFP
jgi:hypothetical protein